MARIAGVNIPDNKHIVISLCYVYGIGLTTANKICDKTGVSPSTKTGELNPEELDALRGEVNNVTVEGGSSQRSVNEHQAVDGSWLQSRHPT